MQKKILGKIAALSVLSSVLSQTNAQNIDSTKQIVLKVFSEIKTNSVYTRNVDWNLIDPLFRFRVDTSSSVDYQFRQFRWLFSELKDFHSAVYYHNRAYQVTKPTPGGRTNEFKTLLDAVSRNGKKIEVELLPGNIAYILIPAANVLDSTSVDSLSRAWRQKVCETVTWNVKGYILDLRLNMGGNMYPMFAAITHLLGNRQVVGTFNGKKVNDWWIIKNGDIFFGDYQATHLGKSSLENTPNSPVAVITSYFTISSGEILTTAFKQRPHSLQIGDTTGGLVTNNHYYRVADDTFLNLSVGYFADRKSKIYREGIAPDIYIRGGDDFGNKLADDKIKAAIEWIKRQSDFR